MCVCACVFWECEVSTCVHVSVSVFSVRVSGAQSAIVITRKVQVKVVFGIYKTLLLLGDQSSDYGGHV